MSESQSSVGQRPFPSRLSIATVSILGLVLGACSPQTSGDVMVTVVAAPGTVRPEYLAVTWMSGPRTLVDNQRVPRTGTLPASGKLADLSFSLHQADGSERKLLVLGYSGTSLTGWASLRVGVPLRGQETLPLSMSMPLTDLDGDGFADPVDDCLGPGAAPCPSDGGALDPRGVRDAGPAEAGGPSVPVGDAGATTDAGWPDVGPADLPASGLLAAWRLDEGQGDVAHDASANRNHAMLRNVGGSPWVAGRKGGGIATSTGTWLYVPHTPSTDSISSGFSLASWLYIDPGAGGESYQAVVARQRGTGTANWFWLGLRDGRVRFAVHHLAVETTATAAQNRWVHVAATFDGTTAHLYVDGQLAGMQTLDTAPAVTDTTGISVGADINGADPGQGARRFGGSLDDVLLYNRPLLPGEIAALAGP